MEELKLNLGSIQNARFKLSDSCLEELARLEAALDKDDNLQIRLGLISSKQFESQVLQVLMLGRPETEIELLGKVIQILFKMTSHIKMKQGEKEPSNETLINAHKQFLSKVKDAFNEPKYTWPVIRLLKQLTSKPEDDEMKETIVKNSLHLFINLLQIPDYQASSTAAAVIANLQRPCRQYGFIWYILYQNFDAVLISLIANHRSTYEVMMLLMLLYEDIPPHRIQEQIREWIATASLNVTSESNYPESTASSNEDQNKEKRIDPASEQTVSPGPKPSTSVHVDSGSSSDSGSDSLESEPRFDLGDEVEEDLDKEVMDESSVSATGEPARKRPRLRVQNERMKGKRRRTKRERDRSHRDTGLSSEVTEKSSSGSDGPDPWLVRNSDLSDHGYASYINELNLRKRINLSVENMTEKEKYERAKRLIHHRLEGSCRKSRTLVYHIATEADVLDILTDFSIDFFLKGYSILLDDIYNIIRSPNACDRRQYEYKEFFAWLLSYFCPVVGELRMQLSRVPLNYQTFHFLIAETFSNAFKIYGSAKPHAKHVNLISAFVRAQRCYLETLKTIQENAVIEDLGRCNINLIYQQIVKTRNVRQLYVFLTFLASEKNMLSCKYLSNMVVANHVHLTMIQHFNTNKQYFNMTDHISQFAKPSMMKPYGHLLENFRENSNLVNDCVFTMMHHVAGDLRCPLALEVDPLPKAVRQIVRQGVRLCDHWQDLIEYLSNYYNSKSETDSKSSSKSTSSSTKKGSVPLMEQRSNVSLDSRRGESGSRNLSQTSPSPRTSPQAAKGNEASEISEVEQSSGTESVAESTSEKQEKRMVLKKKKIRQLAVELSSQDKGYLLEWLKYSLLDIWRARLVADSEQVISNLIPLEPLPHFYVSRKMAVPLLPYNSSLAEGLQHPKFKMLLEETGMSFEGSCPYLRNSVPKTFLVQAALAIGPVEDEEMYPELITESKTEGD